MKRDHGLARAGGHGDQNAAFALEDGLHHAVDDDLLVVVRNLAAGQIEGSEQASDEVVVGELLRGAQA